MHGSFSTKGAAFVDVKMGPYQGGFKAYVLEAPPYLFILGINEFKTFGIAWTSPYLVDERTEAVVAQVKGAEEDVKTADEKNKTEQTLKLGEAGVQKLNEQYKSIFSEHDFDVRHTTLLECSIHLRPPRARPIEDFWSLLERRVWATDKKPETIEELRERIKYCIENLDLDVARRIFASCKKRVTVCAREGIVASIH